MTIEWSDEFQRAYLAIVAGYISGVATCAIAAYYVYFPHD